MVASLTDPAFVGASMAKPASFVADCVTALLLHHGTPESLIRLIYARASSWSQSIQVRLLPSCVYDSQKNLMIVHCCILISFLHCRHVYIQTRKFDHFSKVFLARRFVCRHLSFCILVFFFRGCFRLSYHWCFYGVWRVSVREDLSHPRHRSQRRCCFCVSLIAFLETT